MPARAHISCGVLVNSPCDIYNTITFASQNGYQFVIANIVHPRFRREFLSGKALNRPGAFTRSDLLLSTQDWNTFVVGKISSWINVDSAVVAVRRNSEIALDQELNYAAHLGLPAVLISLSSSNCANLARHIFSKLLGTPNHQTIYNIWVYVPMRSPVDEITTFINTPSLEESEQSLKPSYSTWEWWNTFRTICSTDKRLGVALELSADMPGYCEIERWLGEPLKCIIINTSLFITNKKGYPILPRAHQNLLRKMFKLDVQVVISGNNRHLDIKHYQMYLDHLWTNQDPEDALSTYAKGYEDYLQIPLQPLMDNLESCTYEIFEKDPTKYTEYQKAIYTALLDMVSEEEKETKTVVLMVVGAGRGPLVRAAIQAAKNADRLLKVYAVEKNPNAVVTLQAQQNEMWGDQVTVVSCDMREWEAPEKADIIVSELLGSFGDNELSPECLDGAQKFLKDDGICIPSSYTNYVTPVSAPKLHSEIAQSKDKERPSVSYFEMPYVVHLHNHTQLSSAQQLFSFHHPNRVEVPDNTRYGKLTFKIPYNSTIHGFAGYFDTVLYKDVKLSIHPKSHSPGMFSWFPIFFPLKSPLYVQSSDELEVHFWRCVSSRNVWYEWAVSKPHITTIHNPNGRSYTIGL